MSHATRKNSYQTLADLVYTDAEFQFRSFNRGVVDYDDFQLFDMACRAHLSEMLFSDINPQHLVEAFKDITNATAVVLNTDEPEGPVLRVILRAKL